MPKLSVIIITKNEAHNIGDCLASASFADEIIIFDCGSTDGTQAICRRYTPLVTTTADWPGDGPQKNRALAQATGDWVLCLDADERISAPLAVEIQQIIHQTAFAAFAIPYQSTYCGEPIRFGDWRGESHIRLFQLNQAKFTNDIVHCHLQVHGKTGKLKAPIIHHPFQSLSAMLLKMNDYSSESAKILYDKGKRASLSTALGHGLWAFVRGYLFKFGFLDGKQGFILAMSNAQGTYYRYLKLMAMGTDEKSPLAAHE